MITRVRELLYSFGGRVYSRYDGLIPPVILPKYRYIIYYAREDYHIIILCEAVVVYTERSKGLEADDTRDL